MMQAIVWVNIIALLWLLLLWVGYAQLAHYMAKHSRNNLSFELNSLRKHWMRQLLRRELRIADATLISNLERNVAFLASSSMLILLGLLTAMAATDSIQAILSDIPYAVENTALLINLKLVTLIVIYVYAFFTFSWSMRQYGFVVVVFGAAPTPQDVAADAELMEGYIESGSKLIDLAGHTYNSGLRAYYFSLSVLAWFFSHWLFMLASTAVVVVLYIREFHSRPLRELSMLSRFYKQQKKG
ncbi:MAG: DUF599 domain-containing protein [Cellvibrionaceae bacterium]|nr:DUF599 domain-containing protein [Cellvibrionaceae bacterium]